MAVPPNFFCIGAQKSGTTLLYDLLKEVDEIYLPYKKEIHFFDSQIVDKLNTKLYLKSYFKESSSYEARGEITPSYLFVEPVAKRIFQSLGPDVKFIVLLRNPMERAYSHYVMKYKSEEECHSFKNALFLEQDRIHNNLTDLKRFSYASRGFYAKQIEYYLNYFNKKNFKFILFEEFIKNQNQTVNEICSFLGVSNTKTFKNKVVHNSQLSLKQRLKFYTLNKESVTLASALFSSSYPNLHVSMKTMLQERYYEDIKNLEAIIDKDLSVWLQ